MYVKYRFSLSPWVKSLLAEMEPEFGYNGFGQFIFYRTYSRLKPDGSQESWADVVIRVTEGTFSIRKDWYRRNKIEWDEGYWQSYAKDFAISMFKMEWLPPGRGLWAMGTPFVYSRGSMALYNCAYTRLDAQTLDNDIHWTMDGLMNGVGVGFGPVRDELVAHDPGKATYDYVIPDTREGWCDATSHLVRSFLNPESPRPHLIYDKIRAAGEPIRGFGGVASGPEPLKELHEGIIESFYEYLDSSEYDVVRLKTDLANRVGCCVVAGNVRRSAEIALAPIKDPVFMDLKDYTKYPDRAAFGWMSNNSVILESDEDFNRIGEIASRVIHNGEPGYVNLRNFKVGRVGKDMDGLREDKAIGINPCGEIPLENKEVCNLAETIPTRCETEQDWLNACEYAAMYCTTVSLLPTHRAETNKMIAKNRRIGVGIIDVQNWKSEIGTTGLTRMLRTGYKRVREAGERSNAEAGVPAPIRFTTSKPGGTTPKLPGCVSGFMRPTFNFTLRLVTVARNSPVFRVLVAAGIPYQVSVREPKTTVLFEFPIYQVGTSAERVSLWEQAMDLVLMQREWADNAVSNTLYFKPRWKLKSLLTLGKREEYEEQYRDMKQYKIQDTPFGDLGLYEYDPTHEEHHIEPVLAVLAPLTKSVSLLPHMAQGVYPQTPETGISEEEYKERLRKLNTIDWTMLSGSDGQDNRYCDGETCEVRQ